MTLIWCKILQFFSHYRNTFSIEFIFNRIVLQCVQIQRNQFQWIYHQCCCPAKLPVINKYQKVFAYRNNFQFNETSKLMDIFQNANHCSKNKSITFPYYAINLDEVYTITFKNANSNDQLLIIHNLSHFHSCEWVN